jgi:hypothetical protein
VERPIESVQIVSDGILVRFSDGTLTYFPQTFLRDNIGVGANQVFLDYDPSGSVTTDCPRSFLQ